MSFGGDLFTFVLFGLEVVQALLEVLVSTNFHLQVGEAFAPQKLDPILLISPQVVVSLRLFFQISSFERIVFKHFSINIWVHYLVFQ